MCTKPNSAPGNVYVNLDRTLPTSLNLIQGQNLIFVRALGSAGDKILRRLELPAPYFVSSGELPRGYEIPGQPARTFVLSVSLVNQCGSGLISIEFESASDCALTRPRLKLPFSIVAN